MDSKLISLNELSDQTGLPVAWLRREAEAKRLPSIRVGRRLMFNLGLVREALIDIQRGGARDSDKIKS